MKPILHAELNMYQKDGNAYCDSLQIAEDFNKLHHHVLRDIESLIEELKQSNQNWIDYFIKVKYRDSKNRMQPKYLMSRDGFTLLVMGFNGKKAFRFKLMYINRFNQMEAWIKTYIASRMEFPAFTDAIALNHEKPMHYHFSNEINMIYRIVLGTDAKGFRLAHGLEKDEVIKPHLNLGQIKAVESLQQIDIGLLEAKMLFEERKKILMNSFRLRSASFMEIIPERVKPALTLPQKPSDAVQTGWNVF